MLRYWCHFTVFCHVCFRILGTPTEDTWPGVYDLPDFKRTFPHWSARDLTEVVSGLSREGCELLSVCA